MGWVLAAFPLYSADVAGKAISATPSVSSRRLLPLWVWMISAHCSFLHACLIWCFHQFRGWCSTCRSGSPGLERMYGEFQVHPHRCTSRAIVATGPLSLPRIHPVSCRSFHTFSNSFRIPFFLSRTRRMTLILHIRRLGKGQSDVL